MMLMVPHLSWVFVLSFIGCKWSDFGGEFSIMLMSAHPSWLLLYYS